MITLGKGNRTFKTVEFYSVMIATLVAELVILILVRLSYIHAELIPISIGNKSGTIVSMSSTLIGFLVTSLALIESFFPMEQIRNIRESESAPSIPGFFLLTIAALFILLLFSLFISLTGIQNFFISIITLFFLLFSLASLSVSLLVFGLIVKQVHSGEAK